MAKLEDGTWEAERKLIGHHLVNDGNYYIFRIKHSKYGDAKGAFLLPTTDKLKDASDELSYHLGKKCDLIGVYKLRKDNKPWTYEYKDRSQQWVGFIGYASDDDDLKKKIEIFIRLVNVDLRENPQYLHKSSISNEHSCFPVDEDDDSVMLESFLSNEDYKSVLEKGEAIKAKKKATSKATSTGKRRAVKTEACSSPTKKSKALEPTGSQRGSKQDEAIIVDDFNRVNSRNKAAKKASYPSKAECIDLCDSYNDHKSGNKVKKTSGKKKVIKTLFGTPPRKSLSDSSKDNFINAKKHRFKRSSDLKVAAKPAYMPPRKSTSDSSDDSSDDSLLSDGQKHTFSPSCGQFTLKPINLYRQTTPQVSQTPEGPAMSIVDCMLLSRLMGCCNDDWNAITRNKDFTKLCRKYSIQTIEDEYTNLLSNMSRNSEHM
jgi:hypothetical protein